MKKFLSLITIIILLTKILNAQVIYQKLLDTNNLWNYNYYWLPAIQNHTELLRFRTDTIIDGKKYSIPEYSNDLENPRKLYH